MRWIQVLHQHKGHAQINGQCVEEFRVGFQPARRRSYRYHREKAP